MRMQATATVACALLVIAGLPPLARAYGNGAGAVPPKGWNTWCTYDACGLLDKCSDAEVRQQALALVTSGMKDLGYEYVNMDDCWSAKDRDADGNLQPNAERFPYGMKALADYVHSLGLKIGVYTCIGTHTCRNGLPGSWGHYEQDAKHLASWGIDFVKTDNCNRPSGYTELELYTNFSSHLNATGRTMLFSLCEWGDQDVQQWGHEVGQMFRIQMDHLPFYNLPTHAAGSGFGQGVKNIVDYVSTVRPSTFVRQFGWMDPDFLMTLFDVILPTMTYEYSKVEITMWSAWSSPMIVATQVSNMTEQKKSLLMNPEVIAVNNDASYTSVDLMRNYSENVMLWGRPMANGDAVAIILNQADYMWGGQGEQVTVNWQSDFRFNRTATAVRDIWQQRNLTPSEFSATSYSDFVNATHVRYFRVTCSGGPCYDVWPIV